MSFYQPQHMQQPMRRSYEPPTQAQPCALPAAAPPCARLEAPGLTLRPATRALTGHVSWQHAPASGCSS